MVNTVTCVILQPEMEIKCWGIGVSLKSPYYFSLPVEGALKYHLRKKFLCRYSVYVSFGAEVSLAYRLALAEEISSWQLILSELKFCDCRSYYSQGK